MGGAASINESEMEPTHTDTSIAWRNVVEENAGGEASRDFDVPGDQKLNILLLGPVGSGKSSFVNSIASIYKGRIANRANAGNALHSYTTKYGQYTFKNFTLHDTMGVETENGCGFHIRDVCYMLNGNIPKDFQFNPAVSFSENNPEFVKDPPKHAQVHCIIFVVDAPTLIGDLSKSLIDKIGELQDTIAESMVTPRIMCLTKIDQMCENVQNDLKRTFSCTRVRDAVNKASEIFGIPRMSIHPIKNYENEVCVNNDMNYLLKQALQQALDFAADYLEDHE